MWHFFPACRSSHRPLGALGSLGSPDLLCAQAVVNDRILSWFIPAPPGIPRPCRLTQMRSCERSDRAGMTLSSCLDRGLGHSQAPVCSALVLRLPRKRGSRTSTKEQRPPGRFRSPGTAPDLRFTTSYESRAKLIWPRPALDLKNISFRARSRGHARRRVL